MPKAGLGAIAARLYPRSGPIAKKQPIFVDAAFWQPQGPWVDGKKKGLVGAGRRLGPYNFRCEEAG